MITYPVGSSGDVMPSVVIGGPESQLDEPNRVALHSSGKIYVTNGHGGQDESITVYPAGSSGDVAPIITITGPDTGLSGANGIAIGR